MIKENADIFIICWFCGGIGFIVGSMVIQNIILAYIGLGFIVLTFTVCFYTLITNPIPKTTNGDAEK